MFVGPALTSTALLLCPILIIAMMARRPLENAVAGAILGSALLLPERAWIDLPLLPRLDKHGIAALSIYVGLLLHARLRLKRAKPLSGTGRLFWLLIIGAIGTSLTNGDSLHFGSKNLPALSTYDAIAVALEDILVIGLPFIIGRSVFRDSRGLRVLLTSILSWAMLYSVLALIEVRLSPQLHRWVWGYSHHSFVQAKRDGGFRPMVFMEHGLAVAIFFAIAVICALGARKVLRRTWGLPTGGAALYLYVVLVLCKSSGALVFATLGGAIVRFVTPRTAIRAAGVLALMVSSYPILRSMDLVPTDKMVEWARSTFNEERAESLKFRFDNEDLLLKRALDRPLFGWGGFARQRVYDEEGRDLSILDGYWVIVLGVKGWVGFLFAFGFLLFPIITVAKRFQVLRVPSDRTLVATLAVALAFAVADLLPNGLFNRISYYLAGALLGLIEGIPQARGREARQLELEPQEVQRTTS